MRAGRRSTRFTIALGCGLSVSLHGVVVGMLCGWRLPVSVPEALDGELTVVTLAEPEEVAPPPVPPVEAIEPEVTAVKPAGNAVVGEARKAAHRSIVIPKPDPELAP